MDSQFSIYLLGWLTLVVTVAVLIAAVFVLLLDFREYGWYKREKKNVVLLLLFTFVLSALIVIAVDAIWPDLL